MSLPSVRAQGITGTTSARVRDINQTEQTGMILEELQAFSFGEQASKTPRNPLARRPLLLTAPGTVS